MSGWRFTLRWASTTLSASNTRNPNGRIASTIALRSRPTGFMTMTVSEPIGPASANVSGWRRRAVEGRFRRDELAWALGASKRLPVDCGGRRGFGVIFLAGDKGSLNFLVRGG